MKVNCQQCGVEFDVKPYKPKEGRGKYHSRTCYLASITKVKANCRQCGREYSRPPSVIGKYCSKTCAGNANVSRKDVVDDLLKVARQIGHRPTLQEYREAGKYNTKMVQKYGGIQSIWESMDLVFKKSDCLVPSVEKDLVITDIRRVRKELGRLPSSREYAKLGKHAVKTVQKKLGFRNWHEILIGVFNLSLQEAVHIVSPMYRTLDLWLEAVRVLADNLKRVPTLEEARKYIGFRRENFPVLKGKSFKTILILAGLKPANSIASPLTTNDEILDDIFEAYKKSRGVLPFRKYHEFGRFSLTLIIHRFGNWGNAKEFVVERFQFKPQTVKHLSHVEDPSRERLKESSVEAIKDFFGKANAG